MDKNEALIVLGKAYLLFPNLTLNEPVAIAWAHAFKDENVWAFDGALQACLREPGREFFPTPGVVQETLNQRRRSPLDRMSAEEAWLFALMIAEYCGTDRERKKEVDKREQMGKRKRLVRAIRTVGYSWIRLVANPMTRGPELTAKKAEEVRRNFITAYDMELETESAETLPFDVNAAHAKELLAVAKIDEMNIF